MTELRTSTAVPVHVGDGRDPTVGPVDEPGSTDASREVATESAEGAADTETRAADEHVGRTIHLPDVPVRKVVALGLIGVGTLIALFLIYLFAFTPMSASRDQQSLAQSVIGQTRFRYTLTQPQTPPDGAAVAVLSIPAVNLRQMVVEGTSAADLMNGPGLMPGSSLPGSVGNSVIAGRRVTFGGPFGSLGQLHRNDVIKVVDGLGTFRYRVSRVYTVSAGQRDVVAPTADNRLTLVTSNSSVVPDGRLVVQATLLGEPYAVPSELVAVPGYELGLSGDPVAGGLAVLWSLLGIAIVIAAVLVVWRYRHPWLVYLFATPLFIACGLLACESVARALPATY